MKTYEVIILGIESIITYTVEADSLKDGEPGSIDSIIFLKENVIAAKFDRNRVIGYIVR